jgi:hypothetical protein
VRGNKTKAKEVLKALLQEHNGKAADAAEAYAAAEAAVAAAAAPASAGEVVFLEFLESWLSMRDRLMRGMLH